MWCIQNPCFFFVLWYAVGEAGFRQRRKRFSFFQTESLRGVYSNLTVLFKDEMKSSAIVQENNHFAQGAHHEFIFFF